MSRSAQIRAVGGDCPKPEVERTSPSPCQKEFVKHSEADSGSQGEIQISRMTGGEVNFFRVVQNGWRKKGEKVIINS